MTAMTPTITANGTNIGASVNMLMSPNTKAAMPNALPLSRFIITVAVGPPLPFLLVIFVLPHKILIGLRVGIADREAIFLSPNGTHKPRCFSASA